MLNLRAGALAVALTVASTASAQLSPGLHVGETLSRPEGTRVYDVLIPASYDGSADLPLLVDIHGYSRTSEFQRSMSGFAAVAESEGFIVAWPQGLLNPSGDPVNTWNAGQPCTQNLGAVDDVGFIRAMVAAIRAQNRVDRRRIYATGNSCGGAMTHRLACDAADFFAAVAPFSWDVPRIPICSPTRAVPILTTHSYDDIYIFYPPGHPILDNPAFPILPGAQAGFEEWRTRNGCVGASPDVTEPLGPTSICERYTSCSQGSQVGLCSVHTYPQILYGHYPYWPLVVDGSNTQQRAWEFLSGFSLPAEVPAFSTRSEMVLVGLLAAAIALWTGSFRRRIRSR